MRSTASFEDGPLAGQRLEVDRTPIMLRVGVSGTKSRVLANNDAPQEGEAIHAYILACNPSGGFWDGRDPKTGRRIGGQFFRARYRLCSIQPTEWAGTWPAWCDANKALLQREFADNAAKGAA